MKITAAIITRNRAKLLKRCLNSLDVQSVKSFEVLVIDNGSTDNTREVVDSFKKKLKIKYISEPKIGRANARNRVLSEAKGDILATLDDDCRAFENWVEQIYLVHKENPKALAIQGFAISIPKKNPIGIIAQFIHETGLSESPLTLLDTKNASFKFNRLKKLNVKFNTRWYHGEDFEFAKQLLAKKQQIIFSPKIRVYHTERTTLSKFLFQRYFAGRETMRTQMYWPRSLFPKRGKLWLLERSSDSAKFIKSRKETRRLSVAVLMIVERGVYLSGKATEYFLSENLSHSTK